MSNGIDKLEAKVAEKKVNEVKVAEPVESGLLEFSGISNDDILKEIQKIYRLISKIDNRIEQKLIFIEQKLNYIVKEIDNAGVDPEEIKRLEEIQKLENKLNELKKKGV